MNYENLGHQLQRFSPDDLVERCGVLIADDDWNLVSLRETKNSHPYPADKFRISKRGYHFVDLLWSEHPEIRVAGIFHTHPGRDKDGWVPSPQDVAGAVGMPDLIHVVYHPFTRWLTLFSGRGMVTSFHLKPKWMKGRL